MILTFNSELFQIVDDGFFFPQSKDLPKSVEYDKTQLLLRSSSLPPRPLSLVAVVSPDKSLLLSGSFRWDPWGICRGKDSKSANVLLFLFSPQRLMLYVVENVWISLFSPQRLIVSVVANVWDQQPNSQRTNEYIHDVNGMHNSNTNWLLWKNFKCMWAGENI